MLVGLTSHCAKQMSNLSVLVAVKVYVGFIMSHIVSSCHAWRYSQRRQRWQITTAALQVVISALASSELGLEANTNGPNGNSMAAAVAEAVSRPGGTASYLLHNLPPHAGMS